ncbi:hypothetical protein DRO58_00590, partial [Candidatus Bathyarchaeota archaeon]
RKTADRMVSFSNVVGADIKGWFVDDEGLGFEGFEGEKASLTKVRTVSEALNEALKFILANL